MTAFAIAVAGLGIGVVFGVFGAGGSAFATPVLALLGVPGALAVASPLPGMIPAALTGARRYLRAGAIDVRTARLAILGGIPGTVVGGLASVALGGQRLLVLSGLMLLVVGARVALPDARGAPGRAAARRGSAGLVVGAAFVVGVMTGVLANGGGFLLVPLFIIVLGLGATEAAGTSMVAVGALAVPTLVTHWALGHIDWSVALPFAIGLVPGSWAGSQLAQRLPERTVRRVFGATLVVFATGFLVHLGF
jgi:uncharacterized protein